MISNAFLRLFVGFEITSLSLAPIGGNFVAEEFKNSFNFSFLSLKQEYLKKKIILLSLI